MHHDDDPEFSVPLLRIDTSRVKVILDATIQRDGSLVLDGQDLGPLVHEMWGDGDYEYWLTIRPPHLDHVGRALLQERYPAEAERQAWLARHGAAPTDALRLPLLLTLLQELFEAGRFSSDSDFRAWLGERGIPTEFSSYA